MSNEFGCKDLTVKIENIDTIIQDIILNLINNTEDLWKILKYDTPDALSYDNLTKSEKTDLFEADNPKQKIKLIPFNGNNIVQDERVELRVYDYRQNVISDAEVQQTFAIDILIHQNLWTLENGRTRASVIKADLFKSIHASRPNKMIGELSGVGHANTIRFWNDNFMGYRVLFTGVIT